MRINLMPKRDIKYVFSSRSLNKVLEEYDREIESLKKRKEELIQMSDERINQVKQWEADGKYKILGSNYRDGKHKCIMFIIRYPDGMQKEYRFRFDKISDMRTKLKELKEQYSSGEWEFREDI